MIIDSYDIDTEPIISLEYFYGEKKNLIDKCLVIFSKRIVEYLLDNFECQEIAKVGSRMAQFQYIKAILKVKNLPSILA